jgi:hypothetical protein
LLERAIPSLEIRQTRPADREREPTMDGYANWNIAHRELISRAKGAVSHITF